MRVAASVLALVLASCAYYNGVYNARQAEQQGDRLSRQGDEVAARSRYIDAAQAAESVLTHHPRSRWAHDARYLAGRAWAMAERCDAAIPHLQSWLDAVGIDDGRRDHAALAYGRCLHAVQRYVAARDVLDPLTASGDRTLATDASLWAARATLAMGDYDRAHGYLRNTSESDAEWELARAYLADGHMDVAESLILSRAAAGDVREELFAALAEFWLADRRTSMGRIVGAFDSTAPLTARARLHLLAGELWLAAGDDEVALQHFTASRQLSREGTVSETAAARITLLSLRNLHSLLDVTNAIGRGLPAGAGSSEHRRLWSSALLARMLASHTDHSGAALFLAGEVARDSLRALGLARVLFLQAVDLHPRSPVAPKALLAAAVLNPEAPWYRARLLADYPDSPYASITRGEEPTDRVGMQLADSLLSLSWATVSSVHADSVARLGANALAAEARSLSRGVPR